jgi:tRNA pseudouridine38-40 synthase
MSRRSLQLVVQYDGERFAGWQRQPSQRTVQGTIEAGLSRLMQMHVVATGAGRTDAGVHATGQAVSIVAPEKWHARNLGKALNAVLPRDVRCAAVHEMAPEFHARHSATERQYRYLIGTDADAGSPFRYNREWPLQRAPELDLLLAEAAALCGEHAFRAFAVKGTAGPDDDHRCTVRVCQWEPRPGGVSLVIASNRFLHHMVRFLVGTMVEVGTGRRPAGTIERLLQSTSNLDVSPPAPACGLYLERVSYPAHLYVTDPLALAVSA